jgi:hypothetical protein
MGKAMANTRDATGKAALDAFGRGKARVDSHDLSASTERLNQAANTILTVKAKLEQYRSRLEQMRLNAEIAKEQDKLKAIQEKIQLISDVITKVATVAAAVTGAIAASSAAAAAAEVGAETTETLGSLGVASDGKNYDRASTGLGKVAEGGGVISGFLTYFVFDKEIEKIQGEITRLQGEVAKLQASDLKIDGENLGRDLSSARSAYKEAADKLAESKSSFSNAMQEAGRTWDQRGLTAKQADARGPDAEPGGKGKGASKFSMEAILYMAAALQARKSARRAVSNLFDQLPRLSMAQDIALRALDSNTVGIVPVDVGGGKRMGVMAGVPIDFVPDAKFEPGRAGPSDQTRLDAAAVRRTTDSVAQVQTILEGHGPRQEAEEDDFMAMVSKGTGRKIQ